MTQDLIRAAHIREAKARDLEFGNFGWVFCGNEIVSKMIGGTKLQTTRLGPRKYRHVITPPTKP